LQKIRFIIWKIQYFSCGNDICENFRENFSVNFMPILDRGHIVENLPKNLRDPKGYERADRKLLNKEQ